MKKRRDKTRKGTQGIQRAAPGKVDASKARRATVRRREPRPVVKGARKVKRAPVEEVARDALGRRRRAEWVLLQRLLARRGPKLWREGKPPVERWFAKAARKVRRQLGLSKKAMAQLCELACSTCREAEQGERGVMLAILGALVWGARMSFAEFGAWMDEAREEEGPARR